MLITPPPDSDKAITDQPPPPLSPLGIAVVCFSLLNLLGMPLAAAMARGGDESVLVVFAIGLGGMVAQFGVLPAWLVWGDRPYWQRLLLHWALATLLYGCWMLGMLMAFNSQGGPSAAEFVRVAAMIYLYGPVISLALETPLWLMRLVFGWRLQRAAWLRKERPLAIRDFLFGMAVISAALAAVRAASAVAGAPRSFEIWLPLGVGAIVGTLASAVVLLPVAWWTLRLEDVRQGLGIIAVYAGVTSLIMAGVAGSLLLGSGDLTPLIAIFLFIGSTITSIASAFGLARRAGYRLEVGKPPAQEDEPAKP